MKTGTEFNSVPGTAIAPSFRRTPPSFPRRRESSGQGVAFGDTIFHWMPGQARHNDGGRRPIIPLYASNTYYMQVAINIHTFVKNTDNTNAIFQYLIGDQMVRMMVNSYRKI